MKNKYLFILLALGFISCEGELVDHEEENKEIKFPFEVLDQSNFNSAANTLNAAPLNVRLDSVVYLHYYRFNPETNSDDFSFKAKNAAPPPPQPTNRKSEHFNYNENKQLISKYSYSNLDYDYETTDLTKKGELQFIEAFEYDSDNNLNVSGYQGINDFGTFINSTSYVYNDLNILKESTRSSSSKKFNRNNNQLLIEENWSGNDSNINKIYFLDPFNNINKIIFSPDTQHEFENKFNYPKNIYNPFVNLFPKNFYSFLILGDHNGVFSHLSSGPNTKYYQQIKVNEQGFPEIIQSGSYDNGERTFYYYSVY
nr:hypothetical protein [uncultured Flavobacterium sp.]